MAPTLTDVRQARWAGSGVHVSEVLHRLDSQHAALAREDGTDHPHPRNCVANLVVVGPDAGRTAAVVQRIAQQHPLRAVIVTPGGAGPGVDAVVTTEAHHLASGAPTQLELVELSTPAGADDVLTSIVEPLLVTDVPTYLWWLGTAPFGREGELDSASRLAEVLVVDSATFARPYSETLAFAVFAAEEHHCAVADMQWTRLHSWRELLARTFAPADRQALMYGINGLGIDYVGEGRGNRVAAGLLAGWLASALGWKLKHAAAGRGGAGAAYYEAARSHPVELHMRSVAASDLGQGEVCAIRIEAAAGGRTAAFAIEREPRDRGRAVVRIRIGDTEDLTQAVRIDTPDEAELLVRLLAVGARDTVYSRSLAAARELLEASR